MNLLHQVRFHLVSMVAYSCNSQELLAMFEDRNQRILRREIHKSLSNTQVYW